MKNIIKLILFTLISINVNCQVTQTLPLGTIDYPNGAYLKDLDNQFLFWLGTWEGVANNKKYTFTFIKFTQHKYEWANGHYDYEDVVGGKLKVTDLATNQILYDESSYTDYEDFKIKRRNVNNKVFYFGFYDTEENCYNTATFSLIKHDTNPNIIYYRDFRDGEYHYWDCPYGINDTIPMFLPKVDITLTRL